MSTLSINNTKNQQIEFVMEVQGLPPTQEQDISVRFIIETGEMNLSFGCRKEEGTKWVVDLPPIPHLEKTAYNYYIEAVVDGYYFIPTRGVINVVGNYQLYSTEVKNKTLSSTATSSASSEQPAVTPEPPVVAAVSATGDGKKSPQEIAHELMKSVGVIFNAEKGVINKGTEPPKADKDKDKKEEKKQKEEDEEIVVSNNKPTTEGKKKDDIVKKILSETIEKPTKRSSVKIKRGDVVER